MVGCMADVMVPISGGWSRKEIRKPLLPLHRFEGLRACPAFELGILAECYGDADECQNTFYQWTEIGSAVHNVPFAFFVCEENALENLDHESCDHLRSTGVDFGGYVRFRE